MDTFNYDNISIIEHSTSVVLTWNYIQRKLQKLKLWIKSLLWLCEWNILETLSIRTKWWDLTFISYFDKKLKNIFIYNYIWHCNARADNEKIMKNIELWNYALLYKWQNTNEILIENTKYYIKIKELVILFELLKTNSWKNELTKIMEVFYKAYFVNIEEKLWKEINYNDDLLESEKVYFKIYDLVEKEIIKRFNNRTPNDVISNYNFLEEFVDFLKNN